MSIATRCRIEQLAANLPKLQRGLDAPLFRFVRDVRTNDGGKLFQDRTEYVLLECVIPVPSAKARDVRAGLALREWWPDFASLLAAALDRYTPSQVVDQGTKIPETEDGAWALWLGTTVPIPRRLLRDKSAAAVADDVLPEIEEATAIVLRQWQVARYLDVDEVD